MSQVISPLQNQKWNIEDVPEQTGKVIIITGANSGLGLKATEVLASKGATVVMTVRSTARGEEAKENILQEIPKADVHVMQLDLSSLASVKSFSEKFLGQFDRLDVLINNAGVMQPPRRETEEGFELQIGVNHFGHFALTGYLLPLLKQTPGSRVVTQSSVAHLQGKMNFDDLNSQQSYSRTGAYAQSKLANLLFAFELQRKFDQAEIDAVSIGVHPGYTATNLQQNGPTVGGRSFLSIIYKLSNFLMAQSVNKGVLPMLYAATMDDVNGGDYLGPKGLGGSRGYTRRVKARNTAYNLEDAYQLWQISEKLTGISYDFSS